MNDKGTKRDNPEPLSKILADLDVRISRIERHLNLEQAQTGKSSTTEIPQGNHQNETLEQQIGLYWFAKVGIAALITGIAFLLLQPYQTMSPIFAPALGYILAAAVLLISRYLSKSSPFLAGYLVGSGFILFFFATLRLHFFTDNPALTGTVAEIALLFFIGISSLIVSLRRKSVYFAAVSVTMEYVTALLADSTYPFFVIIAAMALLIVYLALKYNWTGLIIYGIVLTYSAHFIWFINNPLVGNQPEFRTVSFMAALIVLLWVLIFAAASYLRQREIKEDTPAILASLLNCAAGYGLYFLITAARFQKQLSVSHVIASILFIMIAMVYWSQQKSIYRTFFYAMTGYAALTVAIVAQFKTPDFFIWLCWQSLLVVSTAVWFRSKFIVVTNFIIYAIIFAAYLALAGTVSVTSISFGVVALLSARVLNWQKHRLELKTEMMRNAYLVAAFFIIPYATYITVPTQYVSLSWLGIAIAYYVISLILKNTKYRWMSLLTFLATTFYLLLIGITKLEPVLRIISFLVLGMVLLVISFIYTRVKIKSSSKKE